MNWVSIESCLISWVALSAITDHVFTASKGFLSGVVCVARLLGRCYFCGRLARSKERKSLAMVQPTTQNMNVLGCAKREGSFLERYQCERRRPPSISASNV